MNSFKLKKGDNVKIIAGKDKNKNGKILKIDRARFRIVVEGCNIMKKTQKPRQEGEQGAIIEIEAPLHASNAMYVCAKCGPSRIGYKIENGKKARICKKCGEAI